MSENAITRRSFLAGSAGVAAVVAGTGFLSFGSWEQAQAAGWARATSTAHSLCNSCSSKCGFTGYVEDGVLTKMIGDVAHPYCEGTLCARGYGYAQIAYSKDRLTDPLKKNAQGKFEAISWDQAYSEISEKINEIIENHGPERLPWCRTRVVRQVLHHALHERVGQRERLHARRCVQHVEERRLHPGYRLK